MVGIFAPGGRLILRTACLSRKQARRSFAATNNCKWNELWALGFRVRRILGEDE